MYSLFKVRRSHTKHNFWMIRRLARDKVKLSELGSFYCRQWKVVEKKVRQLSFTGIQDWKSFVSIPGFFFKKTFAAITNAI